MLAKRAFQEITNKCEVEEGDESSSCSEGSKGDGNDVEDEEVEGVDDTLDDSSYEEEVAADLHDPPPTAEEIVDASTMDTFSPGIAVIINVMQSVEPPTLTPNIPLTTGTGTLNTLVGEDTSRSLAGKINASGNSTQDQNTSATCTPVVPRSSRKRRGTLGPGLSKLLQISKKKKDVNGTKSKGTDAILEIMKLNMISNMAVESNQEARRVEERRKDEIKLQREKEKEDAKEERLMKVEQNRHEQLVMQGQQFQMMMMQGSSPAVNNTLPANPLPIMQTLIHNNNAMSSVTESPRSILKDSDVILHLDNLK